ncbi:unnamed protein product, partial [Amoebophrya sp. A120]|eukprot:GSA120T00023272001.1
MGICGDDAGACKKCGSTALIQDNLIGLVCTKCGVVQKNVNIDFGTDWRIFENTQDKNTRADVLGSKNDISQRFGLTKDDSGKQIRGLSTATQTTMVSNGGTSNRSQLFFLDRMKVLNSHAIRENRGRGGGGGLFPRGGMNMGSTGRGVGVGSSSSSSRPSTVPRSGGATFGGPSTSSNRANRLNSAQHQNEEFALMQKAVAQADDKEEQPTIQREPSNKLLSPNVLDDDETDWEKVFKSDEGKHQPGEQISTDAATIDAAKSSSRDSAKMPDRSTSSVVQQEQRELTLEEIFFGDEEELQQAQGPPKSPKTAAREKTQRVMEEYEEIAQNEPGFFGPDNNVHTEQNNDNTSTRGPLLSVNKLQRLEKLSKNYNFSGRAMQLASVFLQKMNHTPLKARQSPPRLTDCFLLAILHIMAQFEGEGYSCRELARKMLEEERKRKDVVVGRGADTAKGSFLPADRTTSSSHGLQLDDDDDIEDFVAETLDLEDDLFVEDNNTEALLLPNKLKRPNVHLLGEDDHHSSSGLQLLEEKSEISTTSSGGKREVNT